MTPEKFIDTWKSATLKERSAYQSHFIDLCRLFGHPTPIEKDPAGDFFCFEAGAKKRKGGNGWADVWFKGHFAIEYKGPGADLDKALQQLEQYRGSLENPPLLIACNLHKFVIKTNFTNTVEETIEIPIEALRDQATRQKLGYIFTDPEKFKPRKTRDEATIEAANLIGSIADSIRNRGISGDLVARFLDRVVFCLFAEDTGLLPENLFSGLLGLHRESAAGFTPKLSALFSAMADGGTFGMYTIPHFNGHLFQDSPVVELESAEIRKIHDAAILKWNGVNPAIFGTLFERVLSTDTKKRAQLGAHYTSQTDIDVLIEPVVMQPLRDEWFTAKDRFFFDRKSSHLDTFHERLKRVTVLDPACGSGNFLYVTLQKLLDLELDVLNTYEDGGLARPEHGIGPWNLRAIEKEPIAFQLAQMAVWIGYLQWRGNHGVHKPPEPILQALTGFHNMDAIIACGPKGKPLDPPREPEWPEAEFIVGNPPFLGGKKLRAELGDNYVTKLFQLYDDRVAAESDLCCYWFEKAREHTVAGKVKSVGLLATQGIRGGANREVLKRIKNSCDIFFAMSDRDWILDGANVHVSMVGFGLKKRTTKSLDGSIVHEIHANLGKHADITEAKRLIANQSIGYMGDTKGGAFDIDFEKVPALLFSPNPNHRPNSDVLFPWLNAMDMTDRPKGKWIIDYGTESEYGKISLYAGTTEHLESISFKSALANKREIYTKKWWLHARPREELKLKIRRMERCLVTPCVSKFRLFKWLGTEFVPDHQLIVFARSDEFFFGVLQSRLHEIWALKLGTRLETRPRYTPTTCFETFPFPVPSEAQTKAIASAAADLNEQRENWLNPPDWTRTDHLEFPATFGGPWNRYIDPATIETRTFRAESFQVGTARWPRIVPRNADYAKMLKSQRTLTKLYNQRPTWLDQAHKRLDEAVFAAYGWNPSMTDEELLTALLELNLSRPAVEKKQGKSAPEETEADD